MKLLVTDRPSSVMRHVVTFSPSGCGSYRITTLWASGRLSCFLVLSRFIFQVPGVWPKPVPARSAINKTVRTGSVTICHLTALAAARISYMSHCSFSGSFSQLVSGDSPFMTHPQEVCHHVHGD